MALAAYERIFHSNRGPSLLPGGPGNAQCTPEMHPSMSSTPAHPGASFDADITFKPSSEPVRPMLAKALTRGVSECEGAEFYISPYPQFQSSRVWEQGACLD
ncbi:hypothetical protein F5X98DRAFT_372654 [Xylaria grammica]|nr:hypothetical protein F5X98DRAFT_372654 [Xylaria grammica]